MQQIRNPRRRQLLGLRRRHGSNRANSRRWFIAVAGATALAVAFIPAVATASHLEVSLAGSNFELDTDANLKVDDGSPSIDWASATVVQRNGEDLETGTGDDSFGQGSKEDTAVPAVVDGSIPNNKSDLLNFGFYLETISTTQQFLHLYWRRVQEPTGTTNMDFEFNKNKTEGAGLSSNGVTPIRSAGDLLIQYDLSQGGTNPTLWLSTWKTSGLASQCQAANSVPCWGTKTNMTSSGIASGSINTSSIPNDESDGLGAMSPRTFGEATVDWDQVSGGSACTSFGSAYLKSRSSDTFTSALKDFIAPVSTGFDSCGSLSWLKKDDTGALLAGATFTVCQTHSYDPGTSTYTDITDVCVTGILDNSAPDTDSTAGEFQLDSRPLGRYTITETAAPTGYDIVTGAQTVNITSATVFPATLDFVNNPKMKLIVITCNTVTEKLADGTVTVTGTPGDDTRETLKASQLPTGVTEAAVCGLAGANYDDLTWGTYTPSVELPDVAPLFPVVP